jgi:hypothetical protein
MGGAMPRKGHSEEQIVLRLAADRGRPEGQRGLPGEAAAGLPVPAGFHITTDAYRRFLEENYLGERIFAEVAGVNEHNTPDEASVQIQSLIGEGTIPSDLSPMVEAKPVEVKTTLQSGAKTRGR